MDMEGCYGWASKRLRSGEMGIFLRYTGRTGLAFFLGQLEVGGRGESPECGLWEYHLDS